MACLLTYVLFHVQHYSVDEKLASHEDLIHAISNIGRFEQKEVLSWYLSAV